MNIRKVTSILLGIGIIASLIILIYVVNLPEKESYTEFMIIDKHFNTDNSPGGQNEINEDWVVLGIVNHEQETSNYTVRILLGNELLRVLDPIVLAQEEKWEQKISFEQLKSVTRQKIDFLLYINNGDQTYLSLYLWIDVIK